MLHRPKHVGLGHGSLSPCGCSGAGPLLRVLGSMLGLGACPEWSRATMLEPMHLDKSWDRA